MSLSVDPTVRELDDCGCCNGTGARTPVEILNRPGLGAIAYRVGTHGQFKQSMLSALSDSRRAALANLNTRDDDDFSIALIDAWSMVSDVLSFYQERIANESYLRTATERRSVLEMVRTIGYELAPGVAASTCLAFSTELANGAPRSATGIPPVITIPIGTRAQSIPGQEEKPQTFETVEQIEARTEWNAIQPRRTRPQRPGFAHGIRHASQTEPGVGWSDWSLLGRVHNGASVAIGTYMDGRHHLFAAGVSGVFATAQKGNREWSAWSRVGSGGEVSTDIAVGRNLDGGLVPLRVGTDQVVWHSRQESPGGEFGRWSPISNMELKMTRVAVASNLDGRLEAFAIATDGRVYHAWQAAPNSFGFGDWTVIGGTADRATGIAVATNADGRIEVALVGLDGGIYHFWQTAPNNGWSNWARYGGEEDTGVEVAFATNADGRLELFRIGADGGVYNIWQVAPNNGWSGWNRLGGETDTATAISATRNQDGRLELFAVGTDRGIYHIWQTAPNNGWSAWSALDDSYETATGLTAIRRDDGRLELFLWGIGAENVSLYLKGSTTDLKPGDGLLVIGQERSQNAGNENWDFRRVVAVEKVKETATAEAFTIVTVDRPLSSEDPYAEPAARDVRVFALRQRASLFGANAPDWKAMPDTLKAGYETPTTVNGKTTFGPEWPGFTISGIAGLADTIHLDAVYPTITADSWVVLSVDDYQEVYRVLEVAEISRTKFTLTAKTTRLTLGGENLSQRFDSRVRDTVVYAASEELEMAGEPIVTPVGGTMIELEGSVSGLAKGQRLALSGVDSVTAEPLSQIATIDRVETADGIVTLTLSTPLASRLARESVTINANVALATHGESKGEILGSGDGSKEFQKFLLKQKPLTYTSAANPTGGESTLEVRVNGVLWEEVESFYGRGPREHIYITRGDDDGGRTVIFGDGRTGARLPTGVENVTASYRKGIGLEGEVDAGQIALLMSRPLGIKGVVNPIPASGAAEPQLMEDSRDNAPRTVLTLGRVVSLRDYEDFARSFSGIGKSLATWTWNRNRRGVLITVAGTDGADVPEGESLHTNLLAALAAGGDPFLPVQVRSYRRATFTIAGRVMVDPLYLVEDVRAAIETSLRATFGFESRSFGQPVSLSEVVAAIQGVPGVLFVDIDQIRRTDLSDLVTPLGSDAPRPGSAASVAAAELLTLDPAPLDELEVTQ
jgi:predicted phage baseplate assembly protein